MTGNKKLDLAVGGIILLLIVSALALMGISVFKHRPLPEDQKELADLKNESKGKIFFESFLLETMVINLPTKGPKLRYLEVEVNLQPFKKDQLEFFKPVKHVLDDIIIKQVSRSTPEELNSTVGRIILADRLKREINKFADKDLVKKIYFSKFIVQ